MLSDHLGNWRNVLSYLYHGRFFVCDAEDWGRAPRASSRWDIKKPGVGGKPVLRRSRTTRKEIAKWNA